MSNPETVVLRREMEVRLTAADLGLLWSQMTDDAQAQFFVAAAMAMSAWEPHMRLRQIYAIGKHLRECACSTSESRELVREIAEAMGVDS